jgi:hypothetical protein
MSAVSPSRPMQDAAAHSAESMPTQLNESLCGLGFWSYLLTAVFSITFSVSALLGLFQVTSFPAVYFREVQRARA